MVAHKYTDEEHRFLREFIPGHTYKEIVAEWNKTFKEPITEDRVKSYMANHKINNGLTGRFKKGQVPHNKGKHTPTVGRMAETQFKKGHLPHNTMPVGYERITRDGYIEVKVRMRPSSPSRNDNFRGKHLLVWEAAHGKIPEGHVVIFLDGNKQNCNLENLALVNRAEHLELTRSKLRRSDRDLTETGVLIAKVAVKAKKRNRTRPRPADGEGRV